MATTLIKLAASVALGFSLDSLAAPYIPASLQGSSPLFAGVPKLFGAVVLVNFVFSFLTLAGLNFSPSRKKAIAAAEAAGDKNAKTRFGLPNMHIEGNDAPAAQFNSEQRGYVKAAECFPTFAIFSLLIGTQLPLGTALIGLTWNFGHRGWAAGYAVNPDQRYTYSFFGPLIWANQLFFLLAGTHFG